MTEKIFRDREDALGEFGLTAEGAAARCSEMADAQEIGAVLSELAAVGECICLHRGGGLAPLFASLSNVDIERGTFCLDCSAAAGPQAQALERHDNLRCVAMHEGAKVQFDLGCVSPRSSEHPSVYVASIPEMLVRLQQREFLRFDAPLGRAYVAEFSLDGRSYSVNVCDLSLGGVGLRAAPQDVPALRVGRTLQRVRLELGTGKMLVADLEIRLCRTFRSYLLGEQLHLGCRFVNLPPDARDELRRNMAELQNERRSLADTVRSR